MPFIESSQTIASKLHASDTSVRIRGGIAALVAVLLGIGGLNVAHMVNGQAFSLDVSDASSDQRANDMGDGALPPDAASPATSSEEYSAAHQSASSTEQASPSVDQATSIFVYVSGAVKHPGVYELSSCARVNDAVQQAGGLTSDAAAGAVNLARVLTDGEQIAIPTTEEIEAGTFVGHVDDASQTSDMSRSPVRRSGEQVQTDSININTADETLLQQLPGVGPATATKIVASREAEGPFSSPEDIMRVSGIGQKKYERICNMISV